MNQQVCKNCFSTDIETNEAKGEVICLNCGTVLEENQIVESLEFVENHNGSISMVGQFIPSSGGKSYIISMGLRDSREAALQRGYSNIQKIADHLHLPIQIVEAAQRLYLIALQRNFTMGRNNSYVAAACLYTICRREKSPIMLIDFSDVLQTPMKPLGQTFLKLLRLLHMSVPNIDPSLFLERFAHKLNLKNHIFKVTYTGIKLIQAMTRDWISTGRRPTGLCGAALLISARIHGIFIEPALIADVVRISKPTLIKRVTEFKNTNVAKIKVADFDNISLTDIPCNKLPPCVIYEQKRKKREEQRKKTQLMSLQDKTDTDTVPAIYDEDPSFSQLLDGIEEQEKEKQIIPVNKEKCFISREAGSVSESTRSSTHENASDNTSLLNSDRFSSKSSEDLNMQVDEICNENPGPEDINTLAFKMINTISKESNVDLLKNINPDLLISKRTNGSSSSISTNSSICNGSICNGSICNSIQASDHTIASENLNKKLNSFDANDMNVSANSFNVFSPEDLERITNMNKTRMFRDHEEETVLQTVKNEKYEDAHENASISELSTSANTVGKDLYNESTLFDIHNSVNNTQWKDKKESASKQGDHKEGQENTDEIYNETLKESFNYELNKTLSEMDELPMLNSLMQNDKRNKDSITNGMKLINERGVEKEHTPISDLLPDLNFFFEESATNSLNDVNTNYEPTTEEMDFTLNDDTLSDFATDSEIENMILSEKEKHIKKTIWDDMMKTYMSQYCKLLKKRKRNMEHSVVRRKKKNAPLFKEDDNNSTTGEAVLKALENTDKHMFNKINCDVLNSMFAS